MTAAVLYEVAVAAPLFQTLTYAPPAAGPETLAAGAVVRAPLGGRQATGYVLGPALPAGGKTPKIRPLSDVLSAEPFFPASLVPFYRWIAWYYHFPIGEVIRTALPLAPGVRTGRRVLWLGGAAPAEIEAPWLAELAGKGELGPARTARLWRVPQDKRALLALERAGLVRVETELKVSGGRVKTEAALRAEAPLLPVLARLAAPPGAPTPPQADDLADGDPKLGKGERRLVALFAELLAADGADASARHADKPEVSRARLRAAWPGCASACRRLIGRGLLSVHERPVFRDPFAGMARDPTPGHALNPAQSEALAHIGAAVSAGRFQPFLLWGVTGSGKTEVYLRAVAHTLDQGKNALFLVPEIALAAQLERDLRARFGADLAVLHSGMTDGERLDQWRLVMGGGARVVLGARSAVFAPLENLGLVVVDEEHESSYKQEDGLAYQGRDLAVLRARQAGCPVVLGSATPALTSFHHARTGKYRLLRLPERANPQPLPRVEVVDLRDEGPGLRLFSARLLEALAANLRSGRQSMLFLNRRGFSAFMQCRDCGHVLECRHCRVALTLHRAENRLLCHYCGHHEHPAPLCPACGSSRVLGRGFGTERVEETIAAHFPEARVVRVDSDSGRDRRRLLEILAAVRRREIDILVGTQMIAKGLHFPHVTLVGVLWADAGLGMPDFRAGERGFAQLVQVTGRAGRGADPGRVIIQTCRPDHYALRLAQKQDYAGLYEAELPLRRETGYPPFSRLANLRLSGTDGPRVERAAEAVTAFLRDRAGRVTVLGPAPAPLARIRDRDRWQILLKSPDFQALHDLCAALAAERPRLCPQDVALRIDVDPDAML